MDKRFSIKQEDGSSAEWQFGRVQRPNRFDVQKVLKVLSSESVDRLSEALKSGVPNEEASRFIPFVLTEYANKDKKEIKNKQVTKYALWVLACFWYFYGGGPKPSMQKARKMSEREKRAKINRWVNDNLACPLCNSAWQPEREYNSKSEALPDFALWLAEHSKTCQNKKGVQDG